LRRAYRDILREGAPTVIFIHLHGPQEVIAERMARRLDHFMPASLLDSQYATLEEIEPDEPGHVLDVRLSPIELVAESATIVASLS
jgi:gluconokinase